jgi:hypothetical protein
MLWTCLTWLANASRISRVIDFFSSLVSGIQPSDQQGCYLDHIFEINDVVAKALRTKARTRTKIERKADISNEVSKGTFLKSFDTTDGQRLTSPARRCTILPVLFQPRH